MSRKKYRVIAAISLTSLLAGASLAAQKPTATLLVLEKGTLSLAIVDPSTLRVITRIPSGPDPHEVIASSDGKRAYISNYGGEGSDQHTISVVDLDTHKNLPAIDLGPLRSAHGLDFAGGKLYFTAETNRVIGRYDPATQRVDWILGTGQGRTHMVAVAKDLAHIVTANVSSGTISFLEETELRRGFGPLPPGPNGNLPAGSAPNVIPRGTSSGANASGTSTPMPPVRKVWTVTTVASGRGAEGFDASPDGRQVWAANSQDGTVTVIDVASKKALQTFPIPVVGANRLKFTPDGKYVLVSGLGAGGPGAPPAHGTNLAVVDAATRAIVKQLDLGGGSAGILMDPSGLRAYVAVTQGDKVAVVDLTTLQVTGEISPLSQPDGLAWAAEE
jgi:YVTN family beta-propeller protein